MLVSAFVTHEWKGSFWAGARGGQEWLRRFKSDDVLFATGCRRTNRISRSGILPWTGRQADSTSVDVETLQLLL